MRPASASSSACCCLRSAVIDMAATSRNGIFAGTLNHHYSLIARRRGCILEPMDSLYARLGGEPVLALAIERFYARVMVDDRLRVFFDTLDLGPLVRKQIAFMSHVLGGPEVYGGRDLRNAHAKLVHHLGLSDEHFDAVVDHLHATLAELGVSEPLIWEVLARVAATRNEVLDR